jgi:uncharacterized membrane protein
MKDLNYMEAKLNKIVFLVSCSILALTIVVFISYYKTIPDTIPMHKNFNGEVDSYGSKDLIWINFIINALILSLIGYFFNKPHVLNYPVAITEENRNRMYNSMQAFLAYLAVIVSITFAAITLYFADLLSRSNYIFFLALYLATILLPLGTSKFLSERSKHF